MSVDAVLRRVSRYEYVRIKSAETGARSLNFVFIRSRACLANQVWKPFFVKNVYFVRREREVTQKIRLSPRNEPTYDREVSNAVPTKRGPSELRRGATNRLAGRSF